MPGNHSLSPSEYERALAASAAKPRPPWAVEDVRFDAGTRSILLRFPGGVGLSIPVALVAELADASVAQLEQIHLSASGETLCLDAVDAHISTRGLIDEVFSRLPKAVVAGGMGSMGGGRTSIAKKLSSAENGKKGGRPRKESSARAEPKLAALK